jgi:hypothetical protein
MRVNWPKMKRRRRRVPWRMRSRVERRKTTLSEKGVRTEPPASTMLRAVLWTVTAGGRAQASAETKSSSTEREILVTRGVS